MFALYTVKRKRYVKVKVRLYLKGFQQHLFFTSRCTKWTQISYQNESSGAQRWRFRDQPSKKHFYIQLVKINFTKICECDVHINIENNKLTWKFAVFGMLLNHHKSYEGNSVFKCITFPYYNLNKLFFGPVKKWVFYFCLVYLKLL